MSSDWQQIECLQEENKKLRVKVKLLEEIIAQLTAIENTLYDVAISAVSHEARGYVEVQVAKETWRDLQEFKRAHYPIPTLTDPTDSP